MKKIVLIISIFFGCTQPDKECLDFVVLNDASGKLEISRKHNAQLRYLDSTCNCYNDWDSIVLKNLLLIDNTKILNTISINKNLEINKRIYRIFEQPNRVKRKDTTLTIIPNSIEQLRMEICAINKDNSILDDKYSEQDVISYLKVVKYQANDSIVHEGINLPNYFTEIREFW